MGCEADLGEMDDRDHQLIERIYDSALRPEAWQGVVHRVSEMFGGSPVMLGFFRPDETSFGPRFSVGLRAEYLDAYLEHLLNDLPWSTRTMRQLVDRVAPISEAFSGVEIETTAFYTEWLKPQGLAAIWPAGHTLVDESGEPIGGFVVFRAEGQGPFSDAELASVNPFIPHFRRALHVHLALHGARTVQHAVAETLNRLPTGVLLLNKKREVVLRNRGADRIVSQDDGFRLDRNGPCAANARENAALQELIADAMESQHSGPLASTGFLSISRSSGRRPFAVMVAPLLAVPASGVVSDAVVALFVTDPDAGRVSEAEVLAKLYALTHSEAEMVRLLALGMSLEEAAAKRGVSMNTARSHLKHAFATTGTSRQGELVRLVITGVGTIDE
jgi:DNA-binding CsgD family transcriptional regulator